MGADTSGVDRRKVGDYGAENGDIQADRRPYVGAGAVAVVDE